MVTQVETKVNPFAQFRQSSGAAKNPTNQAVIQQVASQQAVNEDIPTDLSPANAPPGFDVNNLDPFSKSNGVLSSGASDQTLNLTMDDLNRAFMKIPGMPAFAEFAQQMNMNTADAIDFLGPDLINSVLAMNDIDLDISAGGALNSVTGGPQDFMPDGTGKQAAKTAADFATISLGMSAMLKKLPSMLPNYASLSGIKQRGVGVADEVGKASNLMLDTVYGAAGGIGYEYGKEVDEVYGGFMGSLAAPLSLGVAGKAFTNMLKTGGDSLKAGIADLSTVADRFNTGDAEKLIARQLYNEGITPDEAIQMYNSLGEDAMLADLGGNFRALLEQSATVYPRIFTNAQRAFAQRMTDQPARLLKAFDDISGTSMLSAQAEAERLTTQFTPGIDALYQATRDRGMTLTPAMSKLIEASPSLTKFSNMAIDTMADARAAGKQVSTIDYVDYMKKHMDDEISDLVSKGTRTNKLGDLITLKNRLVADADASIPEYKQARESFASLAELKNAASIGAQIFKLSEDPTVFNALIAGMNAPEKRMSVLGMKEAMIARFNMGGETANSAGQMFKARGTLEKARGMFESDQAFHQFRESLRREMEYVATHNQVSGGPATARRSVQVMLGQKDEAMLNLLESMSNQKGWKSTIKDKVFNMWAKKGNGMHDALETAGDILMLKGMEASRIERILKTEDPFKIQEILLDSLNYYNKGLPEYMNPARPNVIPQIAAETGMLEEDPELIEE
jgi:hypothetical protein